MNQTSEGHLTFEGHTPVNEFCLLLGHCRKISLLCYYREYFEGMSTPRILSIQSHVVCGYVGNKSSVFPLHLHGFQVQFFQINDH